MNLIGLHNLARENNIDVLFFKHKKNGCAIKLPSGEMVVGLNITIYNEQCEREVLAEELAHCLTNSFYYLQNTTSPIYLSNVAKAETTALHKKMELLINANDLKQALNKTTNVYELAEMFDVDSNFLQQTMKYYREKNLI